MCERGIGSVSGAIANGKGSHALRDALVTLLMGPDLT